MQRRDREILLLANPPLLYHRFYRSSWIHTKVLLPLSIGPSFLLPRSLHHHHDLVRASPAVLVISFVCGCGRRRVSKGGERYADPSLAKCRKDDLGLYRNADSAGRSLDLRGGSLAQEAVEEPLSHGEGPPPPSNIISTDRIRSCFIHHAPALSLPPPTAYLLWKTGRVHVSNTAAAFSQPMRKDNRPPDKA